MRERERNGGLIKEREKAVERMAVEDASGRREKKRKEKEIKKNNTLVLLYWPKIRPVPNGAQKLQKIENIIWRRNMKTVSRNSIRFAN